MHYIFLSFSSSCRPVELSPSPCPLRFYAPTLCRVDLCYLVQTTLTALHSCCPSLTSSHLSPRLSPARSPPRTSHLVYDDHLQVFRPVTLMSIGGPHEVPRAWYLRDEHHVTTRGQCYPNDCSVDGGPTSDLLLRMVCGSNLHELWFLLVPAGLTVSFYRHFRLVVIASHQKPTLLTSARTLGRTLFIKPLEKKRKGM